MTPTQSAITALSKFRTHQVLSRMGELIGPADAVTKVTRDLALVDEALALLRERDVIERDEAEKVLGAPRRVRTVSFSFNSLAGGVSPDDLRSVARFEQDIGDLVACGFSAFTAQCLIEAGVIL